MEKRATTRNSQSLERSKAREEERVRLNEFGVREGRKRWPQSWSVHCFMKRTIEKSNDRKAFRRSEVGENNRNLKESEGREENRERRMLTVFHLNYLNTRGTQLRNNKLLPEIEIFCMRKIDSHNNF